MSLLLLLKASPIDQDFEVVTEVFLDGVYAPMTALDGRYAPNLGLDGHYMPQSAIRATHRRRIFRPGRS